MKIRFCSSVQLLQCKQIIWVAFWNNNDRKEAKIPLSNALIYAFNNLECCDELKFCFYMHSLRHVHPCYMHKHCKNEEIIHYYFFENSPQFAQIYFCKNTARFTPRRFLRYAKFFNNLSNNCPLRTRSKLPHSLS